MVFRNFPKKVSDYVHHERHLKVTAIFPSLFFLVACVCSLCPVTEKRTPRELLALPPMVTHNTTSTTRPWPSHEFLRGVISEDGKTRTTTKLEPNISAKSRPTTKPSSMSEVGTQHSDSKSDATLILSDTEHAEAHRHTSVMNKKLQNVTRKTNSKQKGSKNRAPALQRRESLDTVFLPGNDTTGAEIHGDFVSRSTSSTSPIHVDGLPVVPLMVFRPNDGRPSGSQPAVQKKRVVINSSSPSSTVTTESEVKFKVLPPKKPPFPGFTEEFYSKLADVSSPFKSDVIDEVSKPKPFKVSADYVDDENFAWWLEQDPEPQPQETFPTKAPQFTQGTWPYTKDKSTTTWAPSAKPTPGWFASSTPPSAETKFPILSPTRPARLTTSPPSSFPPTAKHGTAPSAPDLISISVSKIPYNSSSASFSNHTYPIRKPIEVATDVTTISSDGETTTFTQILLTSSDQGPNGNSSSGLQKIPTNIWYRPVINHNYGNPNTASDNVLSENPNNPVFLPNRPELQPTKVSHSTVPSSAHQVTAEYFRHNEILLFKLWSYANRSLELKVQKRLPNWLINVYSIQEDQVLNLNDLPMAIQRIALEHFSHTRQEKTALDNTWMELPTFQQDPIRGTKYSTTGSSSRRLLCLHYVLWASRGGYSASKQAMQNYVQVLLREQGLQGPFHTPQGTQQYLSIDDPETWNLLTLPLVLAALNRTKEYYPVPPTIPARDPTTTAAPLKNIADLFSQKVSAISGAIGSIMPNNIVIQPEPDYPVFVPSTPPPMHTKVTHFSTTDTTVAYGYPSRRPRPRPPPAHYYYRRPPRPPPLPVYDDYSYDDDATDGPYKTLLDDDSGTTVEPSAPQSTQLLKKKGKGHKKGSGGGWGGGWGGPPGGWGGGWDGGWGWGEDVLLDTKYASKLAKKYAPYIILFMASVGPMLLLGNKKSGKKGKKYGEGPHFHTHVYAPPRPGSKHGHHHNGWARHHDQPQNLRVKGDIQVYHHIMNPPAVHYYPHSSGGHQHQQYHSAPSQQQSYQQSAPSQYSQSVQTTAGGWMQSGSDYAPTVAASSGTAQDYGGTTTGQYGGASHSIPVETFKEYTTAGGGGGGGGWNNNGWGWKDEEAYMNHLKTIGRDIGKAIGWEMSKNQKKKKKKGKLKSFLDDKKNMISEMVGWWMADDRTGEADNAGTALIIEELEEEKRRRRRSWEHISW